MSASSGRPVVLVSNIALLTGVVVLLIGVLSQTTVVTVVGVFLLAVALGLALVNRGQRKARGR